MEATHLLSPVEPGSPTFLRSTPARLNRPRLNAAEVNQTRSKVAIERVGKDIGESDGPTELASACDISLPRETARSWREAFVGASRLERRSLLDRRRLRGAA